jgi:glycerol-3-phosphate acyltransferase PlsY
MLAALLTVVAAYLVGSVSFAVVVSRAFGLPDPHEYGSGNPGATNVLRTGNKAAALLTLAGDGLKGFVAVYLARRVVEWTGAPDATVAAAALAVFLGHLFPLFFGFRGGKGVATGAGGFCVLFPVGALVAAVVWGLTAALTRYASLASMLAGVALTVAAGLLHQPPLVLGVSVVATVFVIVRHRANIARLLGGTENKIGQIPSSPS